MVDIDISGVSSGVRATEGVVRKRVARCCSHQGREVVEAKSGGAVGADKKGGCFAAGTYKNWNGRRGWGVVGGEGRVKTYL